MYGFVPYNISDIQKGIQFGHAVVEYSLKYFNSDEFKKWSTRDKTFIILNGGTTNNSTEISKRGSLNKKLDEFKNLKKTYSSSLFNYAEFSEIDLGNQLTAFVFLLDERVFNKKLYPDYMSNSHSPILDSIQYEYYLKNFSNNPSEAEQILKLREFIQNAKLA